MAHILNTSFKPIGHIHDSGKITSEGHHLGYAKQDGEHGEIRSRDHKLLGTVDSEGHVKDRYGKPVGHLNMNTGEVTAHNVGHVGHVHHDDKLGAAALLLLMQQEKGDKS